MKTGAIIGIIAGVVVVGGIVYFVAKGSNPSQAGANATTKANLQACITNADADGVTKAENYNQNLNPIWQFFAYQSAPGSTAIGLARIAAQKNMTAADLTDLGTVFNYGAAKQVPPNLNNVTALEAKYGINLEAWFSNAQFGIIGSPSSGAPSPAAQPSAAKTGTGTGSNTTAQSITTGITTALPLVLAAV